MSPLLSRVSYSKGTGSIVSRTPAVVVPPAAYSIVAGTKAPLLALVEELIHLLVGLEFKMLPLMIIS